MSEDPFTSVTLDKEDSTHNVMHGNEPIPEDENLANSLVSQTSLDPPSPQEQKTAFLEAGSQSLNMNPSLGLVNDVLPKEGKRLEHFILEVDVSNPVSDRDGNSKSFISYLITTRTNDPLILRLIGLKSMDAITIKVRRRYGDFRFLHNILVNDYPQQFVPPLPPKLNIKYLTGDTFSTSFVRKRLNSLNRFASFLAQHSVLSLLQALHYFLLESGDWETFTKNLKISRSEDHDSLLMGRVVNEELLTETVMNFFTSHKHKKETNKDILEISDKLKKIFDNLIRLEKLFAKLNRKNGDLKSDYEQFLFQITKLAAAQKATTVANVRDQVDPDKSTILLNETDTSFVSNFRVFSDSLMHFLQRWSDLHQYIDESFLVSLRDCAKYIARFSDLIELQHNKKIDLQVLEDYLAKARGELENVDRTRRTQGGPPPTPAMISSSPVGIVNNTTRIIKDTISTSATAHIGSSQNDEKRAKLEAKIGQLEQEIALQGQLVKGITDKIINEEFPNWERFNRQQLRESMVGLCDQEIEFYKGLAEKWSEVELKLLLRLKELEVSEQV